MTIVVIAELGVSIAIIILKADAEDAISKAMRNSLDDYGLDANNTILANITSSWDEVQEDLKCCGVDIYMDWKNTTFNGNGTTDNAPDSCCKDGKTEDCGKNQLKAGNETGIYETGCLKPFANSLNDRAYIVGVAGAGLGVLQIIMLIGAFVLAKRDNYSA